MSEYVGLAVALVLAGAFAAANVVLASVLGPKKPSPVKSEPFECGEVPFSLPAGRLTIKFYLTAILFVLFDVELVFLYPWAVAYHRLGALGLIEMGLFLGILMVGFFYAWDNGALAWQ
jgi:NADH-quinone oxidoreductase subunit A